MVPDAWTLATEIMAMAMAMATMAKTTFSATVCRAMRVATASQARLLYAMHLVVLSV